MTIKKLETPEDVRDLLVKELNEIKEEIAGINIPKKYDDYMADFVKRAKNRLLELEAKKELCYKIIGAINLKRTV